MFASRRLAAVGLVLTLAAAFPGVAAANHSWGGYHWARQSNPFTLKLGDNVTSTWDSYLAQASSDWSRSTVLDTTVVPGSANPRTCKATLGMVQVCNASYGNNGWLGIAGISITGGTHITKAYVKLNDYYFNKSQYNTPSWRQLVTCQEVAHTFGLDHQDTNFNNANLGTCMDYTSDPDGPPSNTGPNQHDYDELVTIYTHLDSSTTVGAALPKGSAAAAAEGAGWGREVARTHGGHTSVFVRDLGRGNLVVTYVIWA
jgi:hypothetical protein